MPKEPLQLQTNISQFKHPLFFITVLMTVGFFSSQFWPTSVIFHSVEEFLPYHAMLEIFSVTISLMVFAVVWNSFNSERSINLILIAVTFMVVGVIDFFHTFSYSGMPDFFGENSPQKALIFWMSARLIAAVMFLLVAIMPWFPNSYSPHKYLIAIVGIFITLAVVGAGVQYPEWFPVFYVDHVGLTDTKINLEYLIVVMHFATVALLLTKKDEVGVNFIWFACAVWLMALAELFFTLYSNVSDLYNLAGHVYKAVAYVMVYKALFVASITRPYEELERRSIEKLQLTQNAVDNSGDLIYWLDYEGRIVSVNAAVLNALGFVSEDMINSHIGRFESALLPDQWHQLRLGLSEEPKITLEGLHLRKNGTKFPSEVRIVYFNYHDQNYICLFVSDISERRQFMDELKRSQQQLSEAQRITHIGSWQYDYASDTSTWSEEIYRILDADPAIVKASFNSFLQYVHGDDRQRVLDNYNLFLKEYVPYYMMHRIVLMNGETRYIEARGEVIYDHKGEPKSLLGTIQDITRERILEDKAYQDPLTGIYNRRFLDEKIEHLMTDAVIRKQNLCYVVFDIDLFKDVNDQFGHDLGDRVLKGVAEYLQRQIRDTDFVCRFGGEEFVVVFNNIELPDGFERIEKIREGLGKLQFIIDNDNRINVTISGGVSCTDWHGYNPRLLFKLADEALYKAKRAGRNRLNISERRNSVSEKLETSSEHNKNQSA